MATYPIKMLRDEDKQAFVPFTNAAAIVDKDNKTLEYLMDSGKYKIVNNVTTTAAGQGVLDAYQGKVLKDNFNNYVPLTQKGVANGVASLDGDGKVPTAQLPSYVDDVLETYIRTGTTALASDWLSLTDGGAALTPEKGKIYVVMTSGAYQNHQYRWGGSAYVLCNPSDVNSVDGMTGVVVLKNLTIQKNGTQVGDTYNGGVAKTINITVPTKNSELTNDSNYVTKDTDITGNAATATLASKATGDKNGLQIDTNYVKKDGTVTMTGTLKVQSASGIKVNSNNEDLNVWEVVGNSGSWNSEYGFYEKYVGTGAGNDNTLQLYADNQANTHVLVRTIKQDGTVTWNTANTFSQTINGSISGNAATATSATKATGDKDGNAIDTTYLKRSGGTMTGELKFNGHQAVTWDNGTYRQRLTIVDDATADTDVFEFQQSTDSGSNYSTLMAIKDNGHVVATSFDGALAGNATTATTADKVKNALTIQKNGTQVGSTYNGSAATTINISVPTQVSDLSDGSSVIKNTTYATSTTSGVIKLGTGLTIKDGIVSVTGSATADSVEWAAVKNAPTTVSYWTNDSGYLTASNTMTGATATTAGAAGVVPAPASGDQAKFLRGDGQWAIVDSATKATQDGSGNVITSTYVKKAGDTMTGDLYFSHTSASINGYIGWNSGTYQQRIKVIDDDTADTDTFVFQQSEDSGSTYNDLLRIKDNGNIITNGALYIGHTTAANALIYLNGKKAINGSDTWLRVNDGQPFTSGVYFGSSCVRTDGSLQVGNGGASAYINASYANFVAPVKSNSSKFMFADSAYMQYNSTDNCIDFIFN